MDWDYLEELGRDVSIRTAHIYAFRRSRVMKSPKKELTI